MAEQTPPQAPIPEIRRAEDLVSRYANSVRFEMSFWDLKLIFGELHQHEGREVVEQHSSMTIPWLQAKVMSMFLQLQVAIYENWQGKITVPSNLLPQLLPSDQIESITDPETRAAAEAIRQKIEQILNDL